MTYAITKSEEKQFHVLHRGDKDTGQAGSPRLGPFGKATASKFPQYSEVGVQLALATTKYRTRGNESKPHQKKFSLDKNDNR